MRKTTIKTSVTYTCVNALLYIDETNELREVNFDIPATAKTPKGVEKLVSDYIGDDAKLVKVISADKMQVWYELDRETFLQFAKVVG